MIDEPLGFIVRVLLAFLRVAGSSARVTLVFGEDAVIDCPHSRRVRFEVGDEGGARLSVVVVTRPAREQFDPLRRDREPVRLHPELHLQSMLHRAKERVGRR